MRAQVGSKDDTHARTICKPSERNPNGFISSQNILNLVRTTLLERKCLVS